MKIWKNRGMAAVLVVAGVLLVATPVFAAAGRGSGMGLRSLGLGGPGTTVQEVPISWV
jgi:hypothetical protein